MIRRTIARLVLLFILPFGVFMLLIDYGYDWIFQRDPPAKGSLWYGFREWSVKKWMLSFVAGREIDPPMPGENA